MKTSNQWMDAAKTVLRLDSDRGLAMHFGWDENVPKNIRHGRKYLNNTEAAHIAEVLKINPLVIIADAETERAKDEKSRLYWSNAAKKFAGIAASVLLMFWLPIPKSQASPVSSTTNETVSLYIMSN